MESSSSDEQELEHEKSDISYHKDYPAGRANVRNRDLIFPAAPGDHSGGRSFVRHLEEADVLFMIIERFRNGDPVPIYRRFRERGRLAPEGLAYISSWVTQDLTTCYQVMETRDRILLDSWMASWTDLTEFEVIPVITSAEASQRVGELP
jgi:uncharacterized protein DUF3303